ncbi:MAG: HAD-IIIA family hydrolase, partial [bacterium]
MDKHKLIIFDADGTLRRTTVEGQPCPDAPGEWELIPGVKQKLSKIRWGSPSQGAVGFGVASNQGGVERGYLSEDMARRLLEDMVAAVLDSKPEEGMVEYCPHSPDGGCGCRKPEPLMLQRLMARWGVRPEETLFVGDMESDRGAAENAGVDFQWAHEFFGWDPARFAGLAPRALALLVDLIVFCAVFFPV